MLKILFDKLPKKMSGVEVETAMSTICQIGKKKKCICQIDNMTNYFDDLLGQRAKKMRVETPFALKHQVVYATQS